MPILYLINAEQFFMAPFVHPDEGMIVRDVQPLTPEQRQLLETTMQDAPSLRARSRAHGLFLRAHGTALKDIAKTSQVHRVTVAAWLKHWEQPGAQSLPDKPRSGRPSTLCPEERARALQYLQAEPQALKRGVKRCADNTDKRRSLSSLKRLATKARLRWKRGRKSLKRLRDPDAFAQAKRDLEGLQKQADHGQIALDYCDASGCALAPTMPYAWQEPKSVIELPARKSGRSNGLGCMNRQNDLPPFLCAGSLHTGVVRACCATLCHTLTNKTVVSIDNASSQTSEECADRLPSWKKTGLSIKYLPPYSPELHRIEILWRRIKYTWLPFSASECLNALSEALETILSRVGSEYHITFA
jgi:transposase